MAVGEIFKELVNIAHLSIFLKGMAVGEIFKELVNIANFITLFEVDGSW